MLGNGDNLDVFSGDLGRDSCLGTWLAVIDPERPREYERRNALLHLIEFHLYRNSKDEYKEVAADIEKRLQALVKKHKLKWPRGGE